MSNQQLSLITILQSFLASFHQWIEQNATKPYWNQKVALVLLLGIFFLSFPSTEFLVSTEENTWGLVFEQTDDLSAPNQYPPESHEAKRTFRLTVPIVAKLLHLESPVSLYALQIAIHFLLFVIVANLASRVSTDPSVGVLVAAAISFTYIGQVGVVDVHAKFDSIAIFTLLLSMYLSRPILIFLVISLGMWIDERAVVASALVFFWHMMQPISCHDFKLKNIFVWNQQCWAIILALIGYILLRLHLTFNLGLSVPLGSEGKVELAMIAYLANMYFFGLWSGLEGLWLLAMITALVSLYYRLWWILILTLCTIAPVILASFMVYDITRSLAYIAPLIFICLKILSEIVSKEDLRVLCLLCCFICFLVPTYMAEGFTRIEGANPLILRILG